MSVSFWLIYMHNTGDQHAISRAGPASSENELDAAASLASPVHFDHPKIHVVHTRRQSDAPRDEDWSMRVKPLALTSVFGVLYLSAMSILYQQGVIDAAVLKVAIVLVAALAAFFYSCFGLRWNRRFKDKSLRLPITLCLIGMMLVLLYMAPPTNILFLPFLFLMMAFAMHRVPPRVVLALSIATLVGYAGVILLHRARGLGAHVLQLESMQLLALCLTLPGFTVLASRVQHLHNALFKATRKIKDIEEDARRDVLLGCFNRRYIVAAIEQQKRLADDNGESLCLAVMDLDHFKRVNDEAGHLGGDEVLRSFARIAQDNIREHDIFGRYGGEEFLLILPNTSLLAALNVAERIREQVEHFSWDGKLRNRVTVSIGLTQYIPGESVLDLFSRTDTAMYMAKQGGRNQVVVEEPAADQPVMT
jgi:diguanylate cyclase (GGDEF)-like protein